MMTRLIGGVLAVLLLWPSAAAAQAATGAREWDFAGSVYFYDVADDRNYAQPTFTADRDWLHLEARFNYEDLDTGSLWLGCNFGGDETLAWELTPMLGGVFGQTDAVAPGYKASLGWKALEFYSEGEYAFTGDAADRFFYNWSELTVSPLEWWRIGLVTQRTRAYQTERELQRGLLTAFSYKALDAGLYVFNPDDSRPVVVVSATIAF